jgi:ferredoxin
VKIAVIGTGPSGWSATKKLLTLGHDVTVIDAGLELDFKVKSKENSKSTINQKLYFGSDLPYRRFPVGPTSTADKVNPIFSFARGGLSLVWGATMLPYCLEDTTSWPLDLSVLYKYFDEIKEEIPITGEADDLSSVYGDFFSRRGIFPSPRIIRFLENSSKLTSPDLQVGLSRLAVETGSPTIAGCVYCNKCISGCPSNLIWNSKDYIEGAKYLKMRVLEVRENASDVEILALDFHGEKNFLDGYEKVFLACGPLESFRILASSKIVANSAYLRDSATFFVPLFALPRIGASFKSTFGLSQLFIRLSRTESKFSSQYQLYEYSDELIARAQGALPFGEFIPKSILAFFLKRMLVGIGYLDGDDSPSIELTLDKNGSIQSRLNPSGVTIKERDHRIQDSVKRLSKSIRNRGLLPIRFLNKIALPGEGVHFGSWLPMGEGSDLLGRPHGCRNIHVVDSSVLPSIAPGPITFTVMANSRRIAEEAVR